MDTFYQKCYLHNVNILSSIFRNEHFVYKVEYLIVQRITTTIEINFKKKKKLTVSPACCNKRKAFSRLRTYKTLYSNLRYVQHLCLQCCFKLSTLPRYPTGPIKCSNRTSGKNVRYASLLMPFWRKKAVYKRAEWDRTLSIMVCKERDNCLL